MGNPDASAQSNPSAGDGVEDPIGDPDTTPAGYTAVDSPLTSPVPRQVDPTDSALIAPPAAPAVPVPAVAAPTVAVAAVAAVADPRWSGAPNPGPVGSPAGPWPYPMYLPARPARRGRAVPVLVAAIVIALLATVGVSLGVAVARSSWAQGHGSLGTIGAGTVGARPDASLSSVLNAQSGALIAGDEAGFLAAVDPAATSAVGAYKRMYANLRALHVTTFDQLTETSVVDGRTDVDIDASYCLAYQCGDAFLTASFDIVDGKPKIVAYTPPAVSADDVEPIPWQASTLSVATGTDVIVAADAAEKSQLSRVLPMAERAAAAANSFARWSEPPTYLVYLADHRDAAKWFGGILEDSDGEAVSLSQTDIEVMVVLPDAADERYTGTGGLAMVIQHEMGHVATLYNDSQNPGADSFIEGIAEYIAYTGHASWDDYRLADTREYVREGKWSGQCYLTSEVSSSDGLTGSASYGIGYLTIKYLVGKYGKSAMLDFWGGVERDGLTSDESARKTFGAAWKTVNASCASYVRGTLHV